MTFIEPFFARLKSTICYFRSYPLRIRPFLPPEAFARASENYSGPVNLYGQIRRLLASVGVLLFVRRIVGLRLIMTLRHFYVYSGETPSEAYFRYALTEYTPETSALSSEDAVTSINFVSYFRSPIGLGQAARSLLQATASAGVAATAYSVDSRAETTSPSARQVHPPHPVSIFGINADQTFLIEDLLGSQFYQRHYNIGYWFWELAQFPKQWQLAFKRYDEIWVATQFVEASVRAYTEKPITRIPPSVEVQLPSLARRSDFDLPEDAFITLYIFDALSISERKNPWAVIEAFRQAFDRRERQHAACLVMKVSNLNTAPQDAERLRADVASVNGILIEENFSRLQTNALISFCDAYLSLHRSEGFGLTMAEAMYLGKPTIATAYSGNLDFMTAENSYPVPYTLVPLTESTGMYPRDSVWAEPDTEAAAKLLRAVYDHPQEARQVAARGAATIHTNYHPQAIGKQILHRLSEIHAHWGK